VNDETLKRAASRVSVFYDALMTEGFSPEWASKATIAAVPEIVPLALLTEGN
jgi:hypothetical protein